MDARGYVYDEGSPDLRVNFQGIVQEKTNVYSVPRTDYQVFYSYRHRSYFAVPFWYDETQVNRYTEGTLTVDLVDAAQNRLVWTGAAIGRVTRKDPQERAMEVDRAIAEIFLRYTFRAGSGFGTLPDRRGAHGDELGAFDPGALAPGLWPARAPVDGPAIGNASGRDSV